jgi:hypothetical protein
MVAPANRRAVLRRFDRLPVKAPNPLTAHFPWLNVSPSEGRHFQGGETDWHKGL